MFAKLCGKGADGGEDFEAFGRGIGEGFGEPLATGPVFEIGDEGEGAVEGFGAFVEGRFFFPDDAEGKVPGFLKVFLAPICGVGFSVVAGEEVEGAVVFRSVGCFGIGEKR